MSLPSWVFYAENTTPQVGDMFVVTKVEPQMYDVQMQEYVACVQLEPARAQVVRVFPFAPDKLLERKDDA
jgi:hypothetical protein